MKFKNFLNEKKVPNLKMPTKKKINKEIYNLLKPIYFKKIPLQDIMDILDKYGIVVLQEDRTEWSGFLVGGRKKTEQVYFDLGGKDTKDKSGMYDEIPNATLALSYYIMPTTGNYEIISYVT